MPAGGRGSWQVIDAYLWHTQTVVDELIFLWFVAPAFLECSRFQHCSCN